MGGTAAKKSTRTTKKTTKPGGVACPHCEKALPSYIVSRMKKQWLSELKEQERKRKEALNQRKRELREQAALQKKAEAAQKRRIAKLRNALRNA